ncbi:hypothetical protein KCU98_g1947, partial [Aureobasidium melanogenum]
MAQSCPRLTSTTSCSGLHISTAILNQSRLEQTILKNGTELGYHRDKFLNFFFILERNPQASDTGRALGLSVYTLMLRTYEICTTRVAARVRNKQLQIVMGSSSLLASFRAWVEETSLRELVEPMVTVSPGAYPMPNHITTMAVPHGTPTLLPLLKASTALAAQPNT